MIRIAISPVAFDAITSTLPVGTVGFEAEPNAEGERLIWLDAVFVERLGAMRQPGDREVAARMKVGKTALYAALAHTAPEPAAAAGSP